VTGDIVPLAFVREHAAGVSQQPLETGRQWPRTIAGLDASN
jgi:hypothetical protein